MLPPAPARLSTMTGWPRSSDTFCPVMRATISVGPPGAKGVMKWIGLAGQAWACAAAAASMSSAAKMNFILVLLAPAHGQPERLQFPVKVRALETRALRDLRHAAVFAREQVLEVQALERLARLAIGPVERDLGWWRGLRVRGEHALDVGQADVLLERAEREVLHDAFQLDDVAWPVVVAQRVQRRHREPARRAGSRLDEQRQHQRRKIGHVFGKIPQRRELEHQLGEPGDELGVIFVLVRERARIKRRERHDARFVPVGAREEKFEPLLLRARKA